MRLPDGTVKVLVEGHTRVKMQEVQLEGGYYQASAQVRPYRSLGSSESKALALELLETFRKFSSVSKKITSEMLAALEDVRDEQQLLSSILSQFSLTVDERQEFLEIESLETAFERALLYAKREYAGLEAEDRIRARIKKQMSKSHREYYLNEQMKAIQKELGQEGEDGLTEFEEIEKRVKATPLSKEAREKVTKELKKLKMMNPVSAESTVIRTYIDTVLELPWDTKTDAAFTLEKAEQTLNKDHFGLEKVKDRIVEFLAVQQRLKKVKGQILCLVGPPGVGKTSLAQSIAKATGRSFVRMSLGGVRDESEVRGHRRTYIGAMPGKILQGMKKAKVSNPVFLLDEIDKMGADWRGDPASAMLEVLDPEQNATFNDHYLELDYDLSDVLFIATANSLDMPGPLLDRMEIIRLEGYTEDEKVEISKRHLLGKQAKNNGIEEGEVSISEDALRELVRRYTREAGVRSLERAIGNLHRKALKKILSKKTKSIAITRRNLKQFAGIPKFEFGEKAPEPQVGITTGLAWTQVGGEILMIEVVSSPGKGKVTITGKLGEVMRESVQAAFSFVKSRAHLFGVKSALLSNIDLHVHVPEGATPKDGPSAGLAICTSIVSALTGIPVQSTVAMTGEINLRGQALTIGGLKEKLLAAQRSGIEKVYIPKGNEKDLEDLPKTVQKSLEIIPVDHVDTVLAGTLAEAMTPIEAPVLEGETFLEKTLLPQSPEALSH